MKNFPSTPSRMRPFPLAFAPLLLAAACGGGSASPDAGAAPVALFAPTAPGTPQDLASAPWPSDLFLDDGGHIQLSSLTPPLMTANLDAAVLADLARHDGFGVSTGAFFPLSAAIDPATVDGHVRLVDLDGGPDVPVETHFRPLDLLLFAHPTYGHVLLEKHHYAYLLLDGIKDASGRALAASPDWLAIRDATTRPSDARLGRAFDVHQKLAARLASGDPKAASVVAAAAFTTETVTGEAVAMQTAIDGGPGGKLALWYVFAADKMPGDTDTLDDLLGTPKQNLPGEDNPGGIAHEAIAYVIQGAFDAPDWLAPTQPSTTVDVATQSQPGRVMTSTGSPSVQGHATIPVTLILPKTPATSDGSYKSLPVVVFTHGINGNRHTLMALADSVAKKGYALAGIDLPFHGLRGVVDPGKQHDVVHNYNAQVPGPDGFDDGNVTALSSFFDLNGDAKRGIGPVDPAAIRGAFQQSVSDIVAEIRFLTAGDLSSLGQADARLAGLSFRSDAVVYSGESFGSILGTMAVAVEPKVGAAVLSVGGGGFIIPLVTWSPVFDVFTVFLESSLGVAASDDPPETDFGYNLEQFLVERGDPVAYAPYVLLHPLGNGSQPRHTLLLEAQHDELVPNISTEHLAGALGLGFAQVTAGGTPDYKYVTPPSVLKAPLSGNVMVGGKPYTAALVQMSQASHGMFTTRHGEHTIADTDARPFKKLNPPVSFQNPIDALQSIYASFADDFFQGRVPTLADPPGAQ